MSAKISRFKILIAGFALFTIAPAFAFEMECGIYEVTGKFERRTRSLIVYPGTASERRLGLYGKNVLSDFLGAEDLFYRTKVLVNRKVGNEGGLVKLIEVLDTAHYDPMFLQYKQIVAQPCIR